MYIQDLLRLSKEILDYLNTQRGMIPKDYAKDLARLITKVEEEQKCQKNS